jgi:hypothetical protein
MKFSTVFGNEFSPDSIDYKPIIIKVAMIFHNKFSYFLILNKCAVKYKKVRKITLNINNILGTLDFESE